MQPIQPTLNYSARLNIKPESPVLVSISTRRALIAASLMICLAAAAGAGLYVYYRGRGIASGTNSGQTPDILSELPTDAPVVAYIDVAALRKLQTSPLAAILGLAGASPAEDKEYAKFVSETGFDYSRDLNAVAIALWPSGLESSSKSTDENRVLAIAAGRFDQQKIKAYALRTGKIVTRGNHSIYSVPGDPAVAFQFLSPLQIAIASGPNAIDSADVPGTQKDPSSMRARVERVAGAPIFAVARTKNLPNSFFLNFHNLPQLERLARSVQTLTLAGQPDGNQIQATLDGQCDSTQNAFELASLLDGARILGSMALSDPKTRGQMTPEQAIFLNALISEAKVSHQDSWVRLKFAITPELLGASASVSSGAASPRRARSAQ
jgi:hypothetical protein